MFLINPLQFILQFEFIQYILVAFGFFGAMLLIQKLSFRG